MQTPQTNNTSDPLTKMQQQNKFAHLEINSYCSDPAIAAQN